MIIVQMADKSIKKSGELSPDKNGEDVQSIAKNADSTKRVKNVGNIESVVIEAQEQLKIALKDFRCSKNQLSRAATEALYFMLGAHNSGWVPCCTVVERVSYWCLKSGDDFLDPVVHGHKKNLKRKMFPGLLHDLGRDDFVASTKITQRLLNSIVGDCSYRYFTQPALNESLSMAAFKGDTQKCESLIALGVDVSFRHHAALRLACAEGHLELVKRLIEEHGGDISASDYHGFNQAYLSGGQEVVEYLILSGAVGRMGAREILTKFDCPLRDRVEELIDVVEERQKLRQDVASSTSIGSVVKL